MITVRNIDCAVIRRRNIEPTLADNTYTYHSVVRMWLSLRAAAIAGAPGAPNVLR